MTEDTQAVVDKTNVSAPPETKVDNAPDKGGDDLDALLSQYETEQAPQRPEATKADPAPKAGTEPDLNLLAAQVNAINSVNTKRDIGEAVKNVRGSLDAKFFDDKLVEAWINTQVIDDKRLGQAWMDRYSNPAGYEKVIQGLGRKFAKQYGKMPDANATDDREAVSAAMRGASTKAPEGRPPTFAGKSNNEYADEVEKNYGYRPQV